MYLSAHDLAGDGAAARRRLGAMQRKLSSALVEEDASYVFRLRLPVEIVPAGSATGSRGMDSSARHTKDEAQPSCLRCLSFVCARLDWLRLVPAYAGLELRDSASFYWRDALIGAYDVDSGSAIEHGAPVYVRRPVDADAAFAFAHPWSGEGGARAFLRRGADGVWAIGGVREQEGCAGGGGGIAAAQSARCWLRTTAGDAGRLSPVGLICYCYISCESCSQFDWLPLTSMTGRSSMGVPRTHGVRRGAVVCA